MYDKILSIVIPTKNRVFFANNCIRDILKDTRNNFEIIVEDNGSTDELRNLLSDVIDNNKLKYNYNPNTISFVENFNNAINRCSGEYVIIIGDDDGINMEIIDVCEWASRNSIDSMRLSMNCTYTWPNTYSNDTHNGELILRGLKVKVKKLSCQNSCKKMLSDGSFRYQEYIMPQIYHGIVSLSLLNKLKGITGHYFGGLTPDIYSSVALSFLADNFVLINYPLTIPGVGKGSGSADSNTGKHTGELADAPHFTGHKDYVWEEKIPYFYSIDTIWGDSAIKAIKDLNKDALLEKLNLYKFCSELLYYYDNFKSRIYDFYTAQSGKKVNLILKMKFFLRKKFLYFKKNTVRLFIYVVRKFRGRIVMRNVQDISVANNETKKFLITKKYNLDLNKKLNKYEKNN